MKKRAAFPGETLLFASGDNVGATPANSGLLADRPAIDVLNALGAQGHRLWQPRV